MSESSTDDADRIRLAVFETLQRYGAVTLNDILLLRTSETSNWCR